MSKVVVADTISPHYKRKIQCPAHFLIPPHVDVYQHEVVPALRGVSKSAMITYGVKKTRRKKGLDGRPMLDWRKIYQLRKKGVIKQPFISAAFAIESVYDPMSPVCLKCRKRCFEGKQNVNVRGIKRLYHG